MAQLQCQLCGAPVTIAEPIPRDAECGSCKHDLRCCRNCRHYDPAYNNSCRETMADPVEDKTRRNFCEYFYFNRAAFTAEAAADCVGAAGRPGAPMRTVLPVRVHRPIPAGGPQGNRMNRVTAVRPAWIARTK